MDPLDHLDWMARFMALMPLRMLRDWCENSEAVAFSGDIKEQYENLFQKFRSVMIESGLLNLGSPTSQLQKEEWMKGLEYLEQTIGPRTHPPGILGNKGTTH